MAAVPGIPRVAFEDVYSKRKPFNQVDLTKVITWHESELSPGFSDFAKARDTRFIEWQKRLDFLRRPTWLYPDDGCFARAAVMNQALEKLGHERPDKIFVFGNLQVSTNNSPDGKVYWWYHVAPIVRAGEDLAVFDPALLPETPMSLTDWISKIVPSHSTFEVSLCDGYAYAPDSPCENTDRANPWDVNAVEEEKKLLNDEWERIKDLHRNPEQELGDHPPWAQRVTQD